MRMIDEDFEKTMEKVNNVVWFLPTPKTTYHLNETTQKEMVIALAMDLGIFDYEMAKEDYEEYREEEDEELSFEDYVRDIFPEEFKINYVSDRYIDVKIDGAEYSVFKDEGEAEEEAIERLVDEPYFWKMAVEQEHTTDGLEEWAEDVVRMDGAGHSLNTYDGCTLSLAKDYVAYRIG